MRTFISHNLNWSYIQLYIFWSSVRNCEQEIKNIHTSLVIPVYNSERLVAISKLFFWTSGVGSNSYIILAPIKKYSYYKHPLKYEKDPSNMEVLTLLWPFVGTLPLVWHVKTSSWVLQNKQPTYDEYKKLYQSMIK